MPNQEAFEAAKEKIIGVERERLGIGTLSEKTVHAILKLYYEPNTANHEIPVGRYVADIFADGEIIEIQTGQFNRMRDKLEAFLPQYPVTIVYPIPRQKWLIWIDEETGEMTNKRKSPARGNAYLAFLELYKIKMFLKNPNLRLRFDLIDLEEYRLLNGWSKDRKKGSVRYDRIPAALVEEVEINTLRDYMRFIPAELEDDFTSKEFAKAAHIRVSLAQTVLNILYEVGIVTRVGKKGNMYLYAIMDY